MTKKGNDPISIVSADETGGAVWFAPAGKTMVSDFAAGSTMTTAGGTATSINAPATEGTYHLYVIDAAGNVSAASTAILTVDNTPPGVTITTNAGNPTHQVPIPVTVTFDEPVATLTGADIIVSNGAKSGFTAVNATTYTVDITPYAPGTVTVSLPPGAARDLAGNGSAAATPLVITFAPQAEPVTGLALAPDDGAVRLTWTNPTSYWDRTMVVRKSGSAPAGPTDGILVYQGRATEVRDLDLPAGTYYYAVYNSYYGVFSAPAAGAATVTEGDRIHRTYQPGDGGSYSALRTAQSWRGTAYTAWNGAELPLGQGPSGAQSGVWLRYGDLIGPSAGQVPIGARIVDARLVLHIKCYEANLNTPYTLKIYRVPEETGLGAPHFGATDGLRAGLDWAYRDHRPGIDRPWAADAADIMAALSDVEPLDTLAFIPAICNADGCYELSLDVTAALRAWVGDGETAQANQGFFLALEGGTAGDVIVLDGATAVIAAGRPRLEVVYGADPGADLIGPAAVEDLAAVPGTGQAGLSWTNPTADFAGVRIVRRTGRTPFNPYDGVLVYDGADSSYTDTGLADGTVYYYAAFAYDSNRNCGPKAWIRAVPGTPAAPENFSAIAHTGYVNLAWDSVIGADSYRVYRRDGSETRFFDVSTGTDYIDWNVEERTYTYFVVGVNTIGEGKPSAEATATPTADTDLPAAPSGLTATTVLNTSVTLSWTDNAVHDTANETGYVIERSIDGGGTWTERGAVGFDITSFTDTNLTPGVTYRYRVKAVRGAQSSSWSDPIDATTTAVPLSPANLTWTVISSGRVDLAWIDAATNETGYRIEICDAAGNVLHTVEIGPNATSYSVTGLVPGVSYIFKVSAVNAAGAGTAETEVVVTGADPKEDLI
ncbi:MAG: fibronectin type III domain-containing protein [Patescibacteria group bacterium]